MTVEQHIHDAIKKALAELGFGEVDFVVEVPADLSHGDLATNAAMVAMRKVAEDYGNNLSTDKISVTKGDFTKGGGKVFNGPRELAEALKEKLSLELSPEITLEISVAGPGFINFTLAPNVFVETLKEAIENPDEFGKDDTRKGEKVMVEYTDPNVMKPFHIGHLMSNAIGESLSRLFENTGAEVKRANYYSDVGMNIAKAVWGMRDLASDMPPEDAPIVERTDFLGRAYAHGVARAEDDEIVAEEIKKINKTIYKGSDPGIVELYKTGRKWSIEHFDRLYERLDSSFDYFYPESTVAEEGRQIVLDALKRGVFEESEGAVVFHGNHTRVFINSEGLPTYEAKELALNKKKFADENLDLSIVITAHEQDAYFQVVLEAMKKVLPEVAERTQHISHGMMRFAEGKMSSRTGNVITGESLLNGAKEKELEKMEKKDEVIADQVAIGAIKYSILKQTPGKDIVFDMESATSLEGDSGPYLQYTYVRTKSLLEKGKAENVEPSLENVPEEVGEVERILFQFPGVAARAAAERAPQQVVHYLLSLASAFNSWYAQEQIVNAEDPLSPYKLAVTEAVGVVMHRGLWLLGIETPERM